MSSNAATSSDAMVKRSLLLLFLAALLQPIVCSTDEPLTVRRDRSSHVDASGFVSDNLSHLNDSKYNDNHKSKKQPPKQPQPDQHTAQQPETNGRAFLNGNLNETIRSIFHVGPEMGLTLFNRPPQATPLAITGNKDFLFPDQVYIDMEPKCEENLSDGKPFCTKVSNYPALNQLESLLKEEFSKFDVFFSEDLAQPLNITQRMNSEPDEEYLCSSVEKVIYPEAAMTRDSNWLLIVNNHENYKQGVRIEECLNEGETCNIVQFPNHYTATCKQNFIYRSLVAITPNGTITKDHFKMPSCCKCVLRQVH